MNISLSRAWNTIWYVEEDAPDDPALRLGVCRALALLFILWAYRGTDFQSLGAIDDSFYFPLTFLNVLHIGIPESETIAILALLWKVSLVSFCLGFKTRLSGSIAFVLGLYLLALANSFGKVFHRDNATPIILLILAVSYCGDRFSIDSLLARRKQSSPIPRPPTEYTWPFRLMWAYFGVVFFAAGYAKLAASGLDWIFSEHMSRTLIIHSFVDEHGPNQLALTLAGMPMLCTLLAAGTIVLELAAPLVLFSRTARVLLPLGIFSMFMGFRFLLGFSLQGFYPLFLFFIPWDLIYSKRLKVANKVF